MNVDKMTKDEFLFNEIQNITMKDLFKLAFILLIVGSVVLVAGIVFYNYTGSAIGLILTGFGITIILGSETKIKKEVYIIMWFAILVLIAVLIGYGGNLPKISFG